MADGDAPREVSEQELQAASIQVSISSYVATATLGALAGAVALFTYLSQNYDLPSGFYWLLGIAAFAFVASLVTGGKGSSEVAKLVATGTWDAQSKIPKFSGQAVLSLLGLVLLLIATAVALGSSHQDSSLELRVQHLETEVAAVVAHTSNTGTPHPHRHTTSRQH